jgi:hypothetical protein
MRLSLFMLGILFATAVIGTRAGAQDYPWCAIYSKDVRYPLFLFHVGTVHDHRQRDWQFL